MYEFEGQDVDDEGAPFWDANALGGAGGWRFASSQGLVFKHDDSPAVSEADMAEIVAAAFVSEQAWHAAMPQPLRTWMQTRPLPQQANHREGSKHVRYMAERLKAMGALP